MPEIAVADRARMLGASHGKEGVTPYGELDDASALMTVLGETGPTTRENQSWRIRLISQYMGAWQFAAGRDYGTEPTPVEVMTPRKLVERIRAGRQDARLETHGGPGSWPLPSGVYPDGYGWIISDSSDEGFAGPDAPLPVPLILQFYEPDETGAFAEPSGEIYADLNPETAVEVIIRTSVAHRNVT